METRFGDFVGIISGIYKNIEKVKKNKMKKFGLSGNHVMCLYYLAQNPEALTASQLCQLISVDKAATSRALSELADKGFVYYPNAEGQRKYRAAVALTEKGVEVARQMDNIIHDVVDAIGSTLSEEERENMYCSLRAIAKNLEELANVEVIKNEY